MNTGLFYMDILDNVVVKPIEKSYSEDKDIINVLKYFVGKGKKEKDPMEIVYSNSKGLSPYNEEAAKQIILLQELIKKNNGRRLYHYVISLPCSVDNDEDAAIIAENIADYIYISETNQVYFVVHNTRNRYHIHIAFNSVSYVTGMKWHKDNTQYRDFESEIRYYASIDNIRPNVKILVDNKVIANKVKRYREVRQRLSEERLMY